MARCAVPAAFSGGTLRGQGHESIGRRSASSAPARRGDAAARRPYLLVLVKYPGLTARSKSRRRRQESLFFLCLEEEMNESRDFDSYKIRFLNGRLTVGANS